MFASPFIVVVYVARWTLEIANSSNYQPKPEIGDENTYILLEIEVEKNIPKRMTMNYKL